jgi:hypothetical protein
LSFPQRGASESLSTQGDFSLPYCKGYFRRIADSWCSCWRVADCLSFPQRGASESLSSQGDFSLPACKGYFRRIADSWCSCWRVAGGLSSPQCGASESHCLHIHFYLPHFKGYFRLFRPHRCTNCRLWKTGGCSVNCGRQQDVWVWVTREQLASVLFVTSTQLPYCQMNKNVSRM